MSTTEAITVNDNTHQVARVKQLVADITRMQADVCQVMEDAISTIGNSLKTFDYIAQREGFANFDDFEKKAFGHLTGEQQKTLGQMKENIENLDSNLALSHRIFRAVISIAALDLGERSKAPADLETGQALIYGFTSLAAAFYRANTGFLDDAAKLFAFGKETLNVVLAGNQLPEDAEKALGYAQTGGQVALDIVAAINLDEVAHFNVGELKSIIQKLCVGRFLAATIHSEAATLARYRNVTHELIQNKVKHIKSVESGQETAEQAKEGMKSKLRGLSEEFTNILTQVAEVTPGAVSHKLEKMDESGAWKDDDPSLSQIQKIIESTEV